MINKNKKNNLKNVDSKLYLVTEKALPKVLNSVLYAKSLIDNGNLTISDATKKAGISRTTYYKYANEIYNFNENVKSGIIRLEILNIDRIGVLSKITNKISSNNFNIIEILQNHPVNDMTKINISVIKTNSKCDLSKLVNEIKKIQYIKEVYIKSVDSK